MQRLDPNIRWTLGNPVEDGEEELQEPEGPKTPQENPQNYVTWAHQGSQRLNYQIAPMGLCLFHLH